MAKTLPELIARALLLIWLPTSAALAETKLPKPWEFFGSKSGVFVGERSSQSGYSGKSGGRLYSQSAKATDHALLFQKIAADEFRGRRLEMAAFARAQRVQGWAGLWVRVDDADGQVMEFDNMMDRPIRQSQPWKSYQIAVDVPADAAEIHFGVLLSGAGSMEVDEFQIKAEGIAQPGRAIKKRIRELPKKPGNLGFEE